jgi:hypothetical protein
LSMAKNRPETPKPTSWNVYKIASKAIWLGEVEAPDEAAAMEKAAAEFKVPTNRLMAIRRWPAAREITGGGGAMRCPAGHRRKPPWFA